MQKNIVITVGQRLRNIRKSVPLTRREIEQKHGISANSIKAWEKGVSEIGIIRLMSYLKIFEQYSVKISIDSLLEKSENYLDFIPQKQSLIKPLYANLDNQSALLSARNNINQDIERLCYTFKQEVSSLLYEKDTILKTLINNLPFKIALKDEHNNNLLLNNLLADSIGGTVNELEGKNCYDIHPRMAKKYHEDDMKTISTQTSLTNIIEPLESLDSSLQLINTNKIPIIHQETNTKMVLAIIYSVD